MHTHLLSLHPAPLSHVECCTSHACRRLHTNSLHPRDTSACVEEGSSACWIVVHTYANTLESCSLLCCQIGIAVEWTRQPACGLPRLGVSAVYVYSASPSHPSHPLTSHARLPHVVGTWEPVSEGRLPSNVVTISPTSSGPYVSAKGGGVPVERPRRERKGHSERHAMRMACISHPILCRL
jgi:hypothetical protein